MSKLQGKRVFLFQQRGWGLRIGGFLARKLQAEGAILAALTMKPVTHRFITAQQDVKYEMIINHDEILGQPQKFLKEPRPTLAEICRELGADSIWPLVNSERNYVRSYRQKFYYAFRQNVPDETIIDYITAMYQQIVDVFERFRPDAIVSPNFVTLVHIMFNLYAMRRGVPMIAIMDSKVPRYFVFTHSYLTDRGPFNDRLAEIKKGAVSPSREKAVAIIADLRQEINNAPQQGVAKKLTLLRQLRRTISPYYQILKWYMDASPRNNVPGIGPTIDYRPPRIILRDFYARCRNERFAGRFAYYPAEKLGKFVYFPLQVQPEEAIDVQSPFFSNQLEAARLSAMALPDDYTLAVKDHPLATGLRSPSYLQKLAATPNIKLIDPDIAGHWMIHHADLVIAPSGTSAAEAAFAQKPVVQLGNLGTTLFFPTVFQHTDMTTLSARIKELLRLDLKSEQYERGLLDFVAAVLDVGISFDYLAAWERGRGDVNELWKIYRAEIERVLK